MTDRSFFFTRVRVVTSLGLTLLTLASVSAASPSSKAALALKPVQADVDYERVASDAVDDCRVRDLDREGWSGWEVVAADGSKLRRFADTNGDKKVDLWCYYRHGIEVYRDVDANFNGKADQYRWLGTGGSRWGVDEDEDGKIDRWKQISAEEVSAELVAALRDSDPARFKRLLISDSELKSLGLGRSKSEQLKTKAERAGRDFAGLAERQRVVGPKAKWVQFAASPPGVVPAGTDESNRDVLVYENAVAMFEQGDQNGQLLVGTVIHTGDAWRLIELPSVGVDGEGLAQSAGNFFTPGGAVGGPAGGSDSLGARTQELVNELESIDRKLAKASDEKTIAQLHESRADLVAKLIEASDSSAERDTWTRQLVDTVSVAIQSGVYPKGLARLRKVSQSIAEGDPSLRAYVDFQIIGTEYVDRQTPDADFAKVQEWYLEALSDFVDRYPTTLEAAQAMLQLALSKEFEDKEREALGYYKQVAKAFGGTDPGAKAAGAVRRLESIGQVVELTGTSIDGKPFKLSALRGRPVVLHYWATWCEPCKQDMKLLRGLQTRYQKAGLQLVGVNIDATRGQASGYLREISLPWPQLFEEGGLEASPLAQAFGVQTLPMMLLIDDEGKLVRHNVRAAELDAELASMLKRN